MTTMEKISIKPLSLWHACIRGDLEVELAIQIYTNIQIYKYTNIQIYKYTNIQIYKYTNHAAFSVWTSGGEDSEIKILTRPQTFQRAINSNITLPCSVHNLGEKYK